MYTCIVQLIVAHVLYDEYDLLAQRSHVVRDLFELCPGRQLAVQARISSELNEIERLIIEATGQAALPGDNQI
jgi:hypothetical protein